MSLLIPILSIISGGAVLLLGKGASLMQAAEMIDYKIKLHKLKFTSITNLEIQLKVDLLNPSAETFKFETKPYFELLINNTVVGKSKRSNQKLILKAKSQTTLWTTFNLNILSFLKPLTGNISNIVQSFINNFSITKIGKLSAELMQHKAEIEKQMSVHVQFTVNNIPVDVTESLAGDALGRISLGYAPMSARDRKISNGSQFDKYFPMPQGIDKIIHADANVNQTVKMMIDIVNQDAHLIKKASEEIFKKETVEKTAEHLFDWIFKYIKYDLEQGEQLRNPVMTYHLGQRMARKHFAKNGEYTQEFSADCDDMSIFIASVLKNLNIPYQFRIASYKDFYGKDRGFSHVYTMIPLEGKTIIIDPVYHLFNAEKPYSNEKTFDMNKNELSGISVRYLAGTDHDSTSLETEAHQVLQGTDLAGEESSQALLSLLVKSRNQIANSPTSVSHILNPQELVKMYDYAIKYWNTDQRQNALTILADKEDELIKTGQLRPEGLKISGLSGDLGKIKFFSKVKNFVGKVKHKIGNKGKSKSATGITQSNYANNSATENTKKDKTAFNSIKTFVADNKVAVAGGTALTVGLITWAITSNKKKN